VAPHIGLSSLSGRDAAAQVKVITVGGLVTGLRGAKAAASAILGRSDYAKELRSLRRELSLHLLIRNVLNRFRGADYNRLLDLLNPKTIDLLGRYNWDHAAKMLYRIILAQPRFLTYVAMFRGRIWPGATNEEVYVQPEPSNRI
jgi:flavin-dependent dehydrogenase